MKLIITESKLKDFIEKKFGVDLTGKIKKIESVDDIPDIFNPDTMERQYRYYLKNYGPMYAFKGNGKMFLYQNQLGINLISDQKFNLYSACELFENLGIECGMGLTIQDLIDLYSKKY